MTEITKKGHFFTQSWYFTEELLKNYDSWGKVKNDLVQQKTIMIFKTVFDFDEMKIKLWKDIDNFLLERFNKSAHIISDLLDGVEKLDINKMLCVLSFEGDESIFKKLPGGSPLDYREIRLKTYILKLMLKYPKPG